MSEDFKRQAAGIDPDPAANAADASASVVARRHEAAVGKYKRVDRQPVRKTHARTIAHRIDRGCLVAEAA